MVLTDLILIPCGVAKILVSWSSRSRQMDKPVPLGTRNNLGITEILEGSFIYLN